jgi:selenium-binding protein 1
MQAPPEKLAYVAALNPTGETRNDAMLVIDVDPASANYGKRVGQTVLANAGDELHHFGWSACSSALCPYAPHPHVERRYLVVPGIRSSRIYILDIKPDPRNPSIVKIIEPQELFARTGYSRPHTVHCGSEGSILAHWALRTGMDLLTFSFWITLPLRSWGNGKWTGGRNTWATISGGISLRTSC